MTAERSETKPHRLPRSLGARAGDDDTTRARPALEQIGNYRLLDKLGEGGMGVVYRALDPDDRVVAIKVLRAHVAHDRSARERLRREVATLSRVRSTGVATVLDADVDGDRPFLVTQYVPGPPLDEVVEHRGPLRPVQLAQLGRGLADALRSIHAAGVVHRDLKPGNVLMVDDRPVVIDFGIAHVADESRLTQTGLVMGTPGYLSPEIIDGEEVTEATDWWGWAATLAFAASGQPPFGRGRMPVILDRVARGQVDLSGVDARIRPLLAAALSPDPAQRPSADTVMRELQVYADGGQTGAITRSATPVAGMPGAAATRSTRRPDPTRRQPAAVTERVPAPNQGRRLFGAGRPVADPKPAGPDLRSGSAPRSTGQDLRSVGTDPRSAGQDLRSVGTDRREAALQPRPASVQPRPAYQPGPSAYGTRSSADPQPGTQPRHHDEGRGEGTPLMDPRIGQPPRSGTLTAMLATITALGAVVPVAAWTIGLLWVFAARWDDRSVTSMVLRRYASGRRRSDQAVAVALAPWHAVVAAFSTVLVVLIPAFLGACAAGASAMAISLVGWDTAAMDRPVPLACATLVSMLAAWWGPGGVSTRRGSRSLVRAAARSHQVTRIVVGLLLVIAGLCAVVGAARPHSGVSWWPYSSVHQVPGSGLVPGLPTLR